MLNRLYVYARGQGLVEYSLIILLVALAVFATLVLLGPQLASAFQNINNNL
jgi:pilus assembly protein Flp/PilA